MLCLSGFALFWGFIMGSVEIGGIFLLAACFLGIGRLLWWVMRSEVAAWEAEDEARERWGREPVKPHVFGLLGEAVVARLDAREERKAEALRGPRSPYDL